MQFKLLNEAVLKSLSEKTYPDGRKMIVWKDGLDSERRFRIWESKRTLTTNMGRSTVTKPYHLSKVQL